MCEILKLLFLEFLKVRFAFRFFSNALVITTEHGVVELCVELEAVGRGLVLGTAPLLLLFVNKLQGFPHWTVRTLGGFWLLLRLRVLEILWAWSTVFAE
jgi:hypothetical protein